MINAYSFYIKGRYEYADSYEDILDILRNEDKEYESLVEALKYAISVECGLSDDTQYRLDELRQEKEYAEEEIDSLECSIDEGRNMINDLECVLSDTDDLNTQRQEIFSSLDNIKERLSY